MEPFTLIVTVLVVASTVPFLVFGSIAVYSHGVLNLLRSCYHTAGKSLGWYLLKKTEERRDRIILAAAELEREYQEKRAARKKEGSSRASSGSSDDDWDKIDEASSGKGDNGRSDWDGIVGFFHPFCNAGGGGERVLWAAVRATQRKWPKAKIVVYTGDHDVTKDKMLARAKSTFGISLHPPTIHFLYLSTRSYVLPSTWPHFTLMGQSLGSLFLAWDAFSLLVPDIFIDTMGYAFALGFSKLLFPDMPTGAYVHYPTISTDMLDSLDPNSPVGQQGVNAGQGVGIKGAVKRWYWKMFAFCYSAMGASVDVVMTNATWTQGHVKALWGPKRERRGRKNPIAVVYPPCAVHEIEKEVELSETSEQKRENCVVYIAQFRPEKNHQMILQAFAEFTKSGLKKAKDTKLILLGSVRDDNDSMRVYNLRLLVNELHIKDQVEFHPDAPWSEILEWLGKAHVGVNGMWNEHFGIGVVEYLSAGAIPVVHNSGGPKLDIVTDVDGEPTGFHASNAAEFSEGFQKAFSLENPLAVRQRGRISARRFSEQEFERQWLLQVEKLIAMKPATLVTAKT